jgi:hypothetical protein
MRLALVGGVKSTFPHGAGNKFVFQPGGGEDFVDPSKQSTFLTVFFRTEDVRKSWTEEGLIVENVHEVEGINVVVNNL